MSGVRRAAALLAEKAKSQAKYYAGIPDVGSAAIEATRHSRQTSGPRDKARPDLSPEKLAQRLRVSGNVIAAHTARAKLSPKPAPRHPAGSKHAWQRKKAFWDALRAAVS